MTRCRAGRGPGTVWRVPIVVLGLVLASALVHAGWNLLLGRAEDSEAATAVALVAGVIVFAPVAFSVGTVSRAATPYVVGSAAFELGYFVLLARAYNTGRASMSYPVARGFAPALVLILSVGAGQSVSATQIAAIGLIATGVTVLRTTGRMSRSGFALGVATAACIAGYTLVDKVGLRHADPLPYLELAMLVPALGYVTMVVRRKGAPAVRRFLSAASVLAGVGVFAAYGLTLAALARGAAAPVAAVRETGIVFLTAMSALILKEPISPRQWIGAIVVTSGVAVIALR